MIAPGAVVDRQSPLVAASNVDASAGSYQSSKTRYAFAYLRVSTEEQTVLNQKLVLQDYAHRQGFEILSFFEDSAVSESIPALDRKGFKDMVELVKSENIDAVLVYELSRVGRTFWDTLDAIKAIEDYAPLISCSPKEGFLQTTDSSTRKLMISILTWVAERERETLVQRTKDGMARARAEGRQMGRPKIDVPIEIIMRLIIQGVPRYIIAKDLGMSRVTMYNELNRRQLVKKYKPRARHAQ